MTDLSDSDTQPVTIGELVARINARANSNVAEVANHEEEEGNTEIASSSSSSDRYQKQRWQFTHNLKAELTVADIAEIQEVIDNIEISLFNAKRYVFQLEQAPTTNRLHIQGYVEFKNKKTLSGVKNVIDKTTHWEQAKRDADTNYAYCTKEDTRVKGPWVKGFPMPLILPIKEFRPWQAKVWAIYNTNPGDREIYWFYDYAGGTGKTALAKYICMKGNALYVNGKATDVKCAVAQAKAAGKEVKCVIWGVPRSQEKYVSYAAIEEIKDGIFFSGKYESTQVIINSPHIFVFSNFYPDTTQLSADRWRIYNVATQGDEIEIPE